MDSQTIFASLRDSLAELYPEEKDTRVVVADAGLDVLKIIFSARAQTNWHNILAAAAGEQQLDALLQVVLMAYDTNPALSAAYNQYHLFIDQGGHIEPASQLPVAGGIVHQIQTEGGAAITGNVNTSGGHFIGHDQINVDAVSNSKGVAIGAGATVNIYDREAPKPRIPSEHPPRAAHFQARKAELDKLLAELQPGRVVTLCGPAGIGKTALAAEAVWKLAPGKEPPERFPDGILFHDFKEDPKVDLVFEHIARSFGEELKPTLAAAAQRALASRLVLLILDSAEHADDLPLVLAIRNQSCVLVTSRQRKGVADRLDLSPLPFEDAVVLLRAFGGVRAADENAVRRISDLVGRLPLALRLVGLYLAATDENATDYLTWLTETPLAALDQGKRSEESIPLLLTQSLVQVNEPAHKVLGVVGLLALAPFAHESIAMALAFSEREARHALGELVNYGLLLHSSELYEVTHALIHTYARIQLVSPTKVVERLADYYIAVLNEHPSEFPLLNHLRPHVLALLRIGIERDSWTSVHDMARAIEYYLDIQGHWADRITTLEAGLTAVQSLQNKQDEGAWLGKLGTAYRNLGQVEQAITYYQQALAIAQEIGDRLNEGVWLGSLGLAYRNLGQVEQAITYYQQALVIAQEIGDRLNKGAWLGRLGLAYADLGQVEQAITYYQQALVIAQEIGDRRREGSNLGRLGLAYRNLGQVEQAITYYQQALVIAQEIGDRRREGSNLGRLGLAYADLGQVEQARQYMEQALCIFGEIKSPNAKTVYVWLESLKEGLNMDCKDLKV